MYRNCLVIEPLTKEKVQKKHQHTKRKSVKAAMPILLGSHRRNPVLLCSYIHLSDTLLTFFASLKRVHKYSFCLLSSLLEGEMDCIRYQRSLDNLGYLRQSIFLSRREDSRQKE